MFILCMVLGSYTKYYEKLKSMTSKLSIHFSKPVPFHRNMLKWLMTNRMYGIRLPRYFCIDIPTIISAFWVDI